MPSFQNYIPEDDSSINTISQGVQAIIPEYKFACQEGTCGNITEWGVDVYPGGRTHQGTYTLNLQVWRPSSTVDESTGTGCYSLVGNNRFSSISLSGGVAVVTPSPQNYVNFRDGDVLGVYVEEAREATAGVVVIPNFGGVSMWFGPTTASSQSGRDCPYTVGQSGDLSMLARVAPIMSIKTGEKNSRCNTKSILLVVQ